MSFHLNIILFKLCVKACLWNTMLGEEVIAHLSGVSLLITLWFPLKTESLHLLTGISVRLRFLLQSLFISLTVEVIQCPPPRKSSFLYCLPQLTHLMQWFNFKRRWIVALVHVPKCFNRRHCDILGNFGAQWL